MSPRPRSESAYQRRIRRYLEAHPGATRQQARGHKVPRKRKLGAEYRRRVERAKERYPGIWPEAARGRGRFLSFLNYIHEGDPVQMDTRISEVDVDDKGRFEGIVKMVIPEPELRRGKLVARETRSFELGRLTRKQLRTLIALEARQGALLSPVPSLDQRRLLSKAELGDLVHAELPMQGRVE